MKYFIYIICIFISISIYTETLFIQRVNYGDTVKLDNVIYNNSLLLKTPASALERNTDYTFSYGVIEFKNEFDSVNIMYTDIPISIDYINYTYKQDTVSSDTLEIKKNTDNLQSDIFVGGIKGFNVSVNNNGAFSFNQSLEMNIEGNIDDRWTLRGNIYDDGNSGTPGVYNIPVSQIDNINITLFDSLNRITLGNSQFVGYTGRFTSVSRQVLGINGMTHINGYELKASIAGQKGQYKEKNFYCRDNIQGPYALTDEVLLLDYIITPESDKIFANGVELKRGENNEYIINYQTGEIFFTDQYVVDANTLIYAQFQTYEQSSSMTGYYGGFSTPDSLINIMIMREEQNVSSQTERNYFSSLGSDSSSVFISTIEYVGQNNGNYTFTDSVLEYAGAGQGDYTASFYYIGAGKGDYTYNPLIRAYTYAGENNGNYMPGRILSLPYESNYFSADILYPMGPFYINMSSGGGLYKKNRYSTDSDYDKDMAYTGEIGLKGADWGILSADMYYRRMYFPRLYREVWNTSDSDDIIYNKENAALPVYSNGDKYYLKMGIYNNYILCNLASLDSLFSRQFSVDIDALTGMHISVMRKINTIADSNIYKNSTVTVERNASMWQPGYILQSEQRNSSTYLRNSVFLRIAGNTRLSYMNEHTRGALNRQSDNVSMRSAFNAGTFKLTANINYKRIKPDSSNPTNTLIMRTDINGYIRPWWSISGNINISSLSEYEMRETYIYAGNGKGDYVYDSLSGNYIYDEYEGKYIRIIENVLSENAVSSRSVNINTDLSLDIVDLGAEIDYSDRVSNLLTFNTDSKKDIYSLIYGDWRINDKNSVFVDFNFINNNMYSNNTYISRNANGGFKRLADYMQYMIEIESAYQSNTGDYSSSIIDALSLIGNIRMNRDKHIYAVSITLGTANAFYTDIITDSMLVNIRKTALELSYRYRFTESLSLQVKPSGAFNVYTDADSADIPLTLYYKYPQGPSLDMSSILSYNNDIFSVSGIYTAQYTQKLGFRQKAELSLYTYF